MMDRRAMKFLWAQAQGPELWLLVLMGVMVWYMAIWQRRLRESILIKAALFAKEWYR
jgi:hypothetical protein